MTDYDRLNEWIELYNSGKLEEPELSRFKSLLDTDPSLRVHVNIDRSINRILENRDLYEFLEKVKMVREQTDGRFSARRFMLAAATVMVMISVGMTMFIVITDGFIPFRISEVIEKKSPPTPLGLSLYLLNESMSYQTISPVGRREIAKRKMLAANFIPLPEYELLVGGISRSEDFKLITPNVRLSLPRQSVITFSWHTEAAWLPLTIVVTDNRGRVLLTQCPLQGCSYQLKTDNLGAGIFYWKFISDEGLILMGSLTLF